MKNKIALFEPSELKSLESCGLPQELTQQGTVLAQGENVIDSDNGRSIFSPSQSIYEVLNRLPVGIIIADVSGMVTYVNEKWIRLTGKNLAASDKLQWLESIYPSDRPTVANVWNELALKQKPFQIEFRLDQSSPQPCWISARMDTLHNNHQAIAGFIVVFHDISKQKAAEEERLILRTKLIEAQRMETIGMLAGGIAHDFNNILQVVMWNAENIDLWYNENFAEKNISSDQLPKFSSDILRTVERGTELIKQILSFARKTSTQFAPIEINGFLRELVKMLHVTFPKTITFQMELPKEEILILADPTQLYQVFVNLCINARDAMPDGGCMTISTQTVPLSEVKKKHSDACAESYVSILLQDIGIGMDKETLSKVFDPFFTTKDSGKGTGLGLSVVYNIIKSHYGYIDVKSCPGKGTTFKLYLRISPNKPELNEYSDSSREEIQGGSETILIIEDEMSIQELLKETLTEKGYTVLVAGDGFAGLRSYSEFHKNIDLVICDLDLPKLHGSTVIDRMKQINPSVPIIVTSGLYDAEVICSKQNEKGVCFIQKPVEIEELHRTIRKIFNTNRPLIS